MAPIPNPNTIDDAFLDLLGLSRGEFREVHDAQVEQERKAPVVGARAPDFVATRLAPTGTSASSRISLSDLRGTPVALIFGSYTCPPFRGALPQVAEVYERHKSGVEFFFVYIKEAHPDDGWQMEMNRSQGVVFDQPSSDAERRAVAQACITQLDVRVPVVLDSVSDEIERAYAAVPSKLYVIDREGRIAYRSGPGPWEFDIEAWELAIQDQVRLAETKDEDLGTEDDRSPGSVQ